MTRVTAERRLTALRELMATKGLDAFVTTYGPNVRYLSGFSGSNVILWVEAGRAWLVTDLRYATQVEEEVPGDVIEIAVARDGIWEACRDRVGSLSSVRRAAFEGHRLAHRDAQRLVEWWPIEWAAEGWVEAMRERKDEAEVEAIRTAAAVAGSSLAETLPLVRAGLREADVVAELEYRIRRAAPEGAAFETVVLSGERSALPHGRSGTRALRPGDLLLIDFGARWEGYCCDITRTYVVGEPEARHVEVHAAVCGALEAAARTLRPGVEARAVDAAAREAFSARDLGAAFLHSTGHGLGLEVHERPRLHREETRGLAAGMVVTLEPGVYFPRWGGVRVEDDYWITESGAECLTPTSRALEALGGTAVISP